MDAKEKARLKKYEKTYGTEGAKVRNRIFKRILKNKQDGTKAGQWSARKAQSLVEEYEEAMGEKGKKAYKSGKKTKSQKSLKKWGDQDWKTKSGKKSSKTGERYLPAKAIDALSDKEYKKTSAKKRKDMKKGKQFSDQPDKIAKKTANYRAEQDHDIILVKSEIPDTVWLGITESNYGKRTQEEMDELEMELSQMNDDEIRKFIINYPRQGKWDDSIIFHLNNSRFFYVERGSTPRKHHRTEDWGEDVDWEDGDDSTSEKNRRPKEWDDVDWNAERFASELYNPKIGTYITTERHYQLLDTNKAIKAMKRNGVGLFWNTAQSDLQKEIEIYPVKKITEIRAGDEIALGGPVEARVLWVNPETRYKDDGKGGRKRINGYAMELEVTKLPPPPTNSYWVSQHSDIKVGDILDKFVHQGGKKLGMTHLPLAKSSWEESAAEWNAEGYYQVYLYYGGEYPNEIRYARTFREARDIEYRSGAEHSEIVNPQGNVVDSQTGKEYPPLVFDAESRPRSVEIKRSSNPEKKLMAVFEDKDGKKIKTTHFGQRGASDYTKHGEKERMQRYLERHGGGTTTSTKENWKDPTTAGALSRWVLWNKPSLSGSFSNYKSRFGLKGDLKVSKSAETSQVESNNQIQFYSGVVLGLGAFLALRSYFRDEE